MNVGFRVLVLVLVVVCGISVGCGSSNSSENDAGPRVEGTWRVIFTELDAEGREDRYTWEITPECASGPCSFRVASKTGNKFRFKFDRTLRDYTLNRTYRSDCVDGSTGETVVEDGYKIQEKTVLTVIESVISDDDGVDYAIQMNGTEQDEETVSVEAEAAGCYPEAPPISVLALRVDKPEGEPGKGAGQSGSAGGVPPADY